MSILTHLPRGTFKETDGGKKVEFNPEIFSIPIDDYHQMCFNRYLNKTMKRRVSSLSFTRALIDEEHRKGNYYTRQSESELYIGEKNLNSYFYNHDDALNRAYAWCRLYTEYRELEQQYLEQISPNDTRENEGSGAYVKKRNGENNS